MSQPDQIVHEINQRLPEISKKCTEMDKWLNYTDELLEPGFSSSVQELDSLLRCLKNGREELCEISIDLKEINSQIRGLKRAYEEEKESERNRHCEYPQQRSYIDKITADDTDNSDEVDYPSGTDSDRSFNGTDDLASVSQDIGEVGRYLGKIRDGSRELWSNLEYVRKKLEERVEALV
ncbi:hypothetical protein K440DRAFT_638195 [Wilcoxina mikolae CBS 423.85]|nr:hypothetical protein K440DRAFT_638195 [Wilcoxina mikolae CBS 423.85]